MVAHQHLFLAPILDTQRILTQRDTLYRQRTNLRLLLHLPRSQLRILATGIGVNRLQVFLIFGLWSAVIPAQVQPSDPPVVLVTVSAPRMAVLHQRNGTVNLVPTVLPKLIRTKLLGIALQIADLALHLGCQPKFTTKVWLLL